MRYTSMRVPTLLLGSMFSAAAGLAQSGDAGSSFSGSIGDPITAGSTQQGGFNPVFDAATSSFTPSSVRSDVNDPTHAQLLGSALSPLASASVNAAVQTAPRTGILSDAQSSVGLNDFGFGSQRNLSFAPGGAAPTLPSATSRSLASSYGASSTQAAFTGGVSANASFTGRVSRGSAGAGGFSGETASPAPSSGASMPATQATASTGASERSTSALTDPVLTGSSAGYDTGSEIHGDLPPPAAPPAALFAPLPTPAPAGQYDDGQTPLAGRPPAAGAILGGVPEYRRAASGFPDSTKGEAGSLPDMESSLSPLSAPAFSASSPFAAISAGQFYEPKVQLSPNLHVQLLRSTASFEAYERRLRRARLAHGASISQADDVYQQDLKDYHNSNGRAGRKSTLTQPIQSFAGPQSDLIGRKLIR